MTNGEEWGTSVLGLSAAVLSLGAEYVRADKSDSRKIVFYFKTPEDKSGLEASFGRYNFNFEHVETEWTNEKLQVNATKYFAALQRLKSVIHSR